MLHWQDEKAIRKYNYFIIRTLDKKAKIKLFWYTMVAVTEYSSFGEAFSK